MSKSAVVTARVAPEILAAVDALAARLDRSRGWVIAQALERYAKEETEFLDFVQVGIDDLEAGRWITHEELVANIRARRSARKAA